MKLAAQVTAATCLLILVTTCRKTVLDLHEVDHNICDFYSDTTCHKMHVDFSGHDVGQVTTETTPHECQHRCALSPACSFFTWKSVGLCFMKSSSEGTRSEAGSVSGPKTCPAVQSRLEVALLVTVYDKTAPSLREQEVYNALAVNTRNPYISEVHVLFEPENKTVACDALTAHMMQSAFGNACLSRSLLQKVKCIKVDHQPTTGDLVRYANEKLTETPGFLLSHADVVFDASLGRVDLGVLRQGNGFLFSVRSPTPHSQYEDVMKAEHYEEERCSLGRGSNTGESWDAYLLAAPIKGDLQLDFPMNRMGAENLAAYQFWKVGGIKMWNACLQVEAHHWHGTAGSSSVGHAQLLGQGVAHVLPCWDCPGVTAMTSKKDLCSRGHKMQLTNPRLKERVLDGGDMHMLCCSTSQPCDDEISNVRQPGWRDGLCRFSEDVDCVLYGFQREVDPMRDYRIVGWR